MAHRRRMKREVAIALLMAAALICFGLAFPPWGFVSVALLWVVVMFWRFRSVAREGAENREE
jgi:apolipoprotein N-acyltransferase